MPSVDFTLADLKNLMKEAIREETPHVVAPLIEEKIEQALIKEREHTRVMVEAMIKEMVPEIVATEFTSFWEHNLGPVLEKMQHDIQDLKHATRLRPRGA